MSDLDLFGRAQLLAAVGEVRPYAPTRGRIRVPWRWLALFVLVDVLVGAVVWNLATRHQDSPVDAVSSVATLAGHGDWAGVRDHLCRADRTQMTEADLAAGAGAATALVHGFAGVDILGARAVAVHLVGPVSLPAEQVSGRLLPALGESVDFTVTTVRELGGWKVCFSVGGYSAPALGVNVPLA